MNGLDLFSGIGGISLGLKQWVRPVAYCENDRYAQAVLLSRMAAGDLPRAPIWDDITTIGREQLAELPAIDIVYGGFPCQDISAAGLRIGLEGKRSRLFFEIVRLAEIIQPQFIFLENVPAIRTLGLNTVGEELARLRYDCRWGVISAYDVGAPHLRKRWFCLAHASGQRGGIQSGRRTRAGWKNSPILINDGQQQSVADAVCKSKIIRQTKKRFKNNESVGAGIPWDACAEWPIEPDVGRVVNGLPMRVDRIKCLGNAVVPKQVEEAFKKLAGFNITY